jgi:hypothetical protein
VAGRARPHAVGGVGARTAGAAAGRSPEQPAEQAARLRGPAPALDVGDVLRRARADRDDALAEAVVVEMVAPREVRRMRLRRAGIGGRVGERRQFMLRAEAVHVERERGGGCESGSKSKTNVRYGAHR